jgi:hypothetical protein
VANTHRSANEVDQSQDRAAGSATAQSGLEGGCVPEAARPTGTGRRIGPWGTATRAVAGAGALAWALAVPHPNPMADLPLSGSRTWGSLAGVLLLPAASTLVVALVVGLRGRSVPPLRLGHGPAYLVTAGVIVLAQFFPVAVLTWIGATLLLLAALGRGGCEVLAVPNLLLRRRDYLVCLPFSAVDAWESQTVSRSAPSLRSRRPRRAVTSTGRGRR